MIKATADNVEIYNDDGLKVFDLKELINMDLDTKIKIYRAKNNLTQKEAKQRQGIKDKTFIEIPDNATNGDMIKAIFEVEEREITNYGTVRLKIGKTYVEHYLDWWNAPYKKGE